MDSYNAMKYRRKLILWESVGSSSGEGTTGDEGLFPRGGRYAQVTKICSGNEYVRRLPDELQLQMSCFDNCFSV